MGKETQELGAAEGHWMSPSFGILIEKLGMYMGVDLDMMALLELKSGYFDYRTWLPGLTSLDYHYLDPRFNITPPSSAAELPLLEFSTLRISILRPYGRLVPFRLKVRSNRLGS